MNDNPDNLRIKAHAGFSLVEVMVGMVIALLGVIIIFQVFSVSEGVKRTTTSGGDALQNGASALFMLERSLKLAGYGFLSANANQNPDPVAGTAPVAITAGAANAPDSFVIRYRPNWEFGKFQPEPANFPTIAIPALTVETISVNTNAQLVSSVNGVISEGIALMKLEYGTDTNLDGAVDTWTQTAPANVMDVWAVRIAVVARSAQPDKHTDLLGVCDTTKTYPTWIGSAVVTGSHPTAVPLNISGNVGLDTASTPPDDWKCYRYKTFENTVALRN
jgi:Tfp pilus assembly protein PilW